MGYTEAIEVIQAAFCTPGSVAPGPGKAAPQTLSLPPSPTSMRSPLGKGKTEQAADIISCSPGCVCSVLGCGCPPRRRPVSTLSRVAVTRAAHMFHPLSSPDAAGQVGVLSQEQSHWPMSHSDL